MSIFAVLVITYLLWVIGINSYIIVEWIQQDFTYMQVLHKWWIILAGTCVIGVIIECLNPTKSKES